MATAALSAASYWNRSWPGSSPSLHEPREPGVIHGDLVEPARFSTKFKAETISRVVDVPHLKRGEAERLVVARILFVADADQRRFQKADNARDNPFLRQTLA